MLGGFLFATELNGCCSGHSLYALLIVIHIFSLQVYNERSASTLVGS